MNEADEPNPSEVWPLLCAQTKIAGPPQPLGDHWLKRLLACNPFYLVSVALLLFGCYRISLEPGIFGKESAHLLFNFSSLQTYELLLVATAIFLARRRIWYDSTLLVGLENLLLLVPFILLTQAALLPDKEMIWAMSVLGGLMAVLRLGSLKWLIAKLNFPRRLLWIGFGVLAMNVALTIIYRTLHESKFGTKLESGPAYETNEYVWMLFLPMLCALALIVPRAKQAGSLWPERAWIPMGLFGLWTAGTTMHLYCLGYVYDFSRRGELLAPTIWVVAWVMYARVSWSSKAARVGPSRGSLLPLPKGEGRGEGEGSVLKSSVQNTDRGVMERLLLVLPILATFIACWPNSSKVFFMLTLFNIAIFAGLAWQQRDNPLIRHLALFSLAALVAGFPESWGANFIPHFSREKCIGIALAGYSLLWAVRSTDPRIGLLGAMVSAITALVAGGGEENALHWAAQIGLVFLLLHSLRWKDVEHTGAMLLRIVASSLWIVHSIIWAHTSGRPWMPCASAAAVLAFYLAARVVRGNWSARVIPLAAFLVILAGPAEIGGNKLETFPTGLLAVFGSFLLFAMGTVAALTRHRWHKSDS
jgi:hypothetical protein